MRYGNSQNDLGCYTKSILNWDKDLLAEILRRMHVNNNIMQR